MKIFKPYSILLIVLMLLSGCATGITPMGKDTYMVAYKGAANSTFFSLKAKCLRDANAFCEKKDLAMVVVSTSGHEPGFGVLGSCELIFRAVPPDDARNVPTSMKRAPDAVIVVKPTD